MNLERAKDVSLIAERAAAFVLLLVASVAVTLGCIRWYTTESITTTYAEAAAGEWHMMAAVMIHKVSDVTDTAQAQMRAIADAFTVCDKDTLPSTPACSLGTMAGWLGQSTGRVAGSTESIAKSVRAVALGHPIYDQDGEQISFVPGLTMSVAGLSNSTMDLEQRVGDSLFTCPEGYTDSPGCFRDRLNHSLEAATGLIGTANTFTASMNEQVPRLMHTVDTDSRMLGFLFSDVHKIAFPITQKRTFKGKLWEGIKIGVGVCSHTACR